MRSKWLAMSAMLLLVASPVRGNAADPLASVQELFHAISAFDYDGMRALVTADFQLLEAGELWTIDTLVTQIAEYEGKLERRNYFSPIGGEQVGDLAWVSYWNMARYKTAEREANRMWLESAVLEKTADGWKIQLLHSTAIPRDKAPAGVQFTEFVKPALD